MPREMSINGYMKVQETEGGIFLYPSVSFEPDKKLFFPTPFDEWVAYCGRLAQQFPRNYKLYEPKEADGVFDGG